MHICLIYPGFPPETHSGGIGTFVAELVNVISQDSAHIIDVISRSDNFYDRIEHISSNVTLYRLGEDPLARKNPSLLFRNNGFSHHYENVAKMVRMIHTQKPIDVIEVADWGAEGVDLFIDFADKILVRCHTPSFISENYNHSNPHYLSAGIKLAEKMMLSSAKHIISPSRSLIDEISRQIDLNCLPRIEPYPINLSHISTKNDYSINPRCIKLLSVGRIEERKGQDIIFRACQQITEEKGIEASIDLIGIDTRALDGTLISQLFVNKLGKALKFKLGLLGQKSRREVLSQYKEYDIYIAASRFDNYPFTLLEAMGAGLPVVGNDNSGIQEIIKQGKTGLLFDGTSLQLVDRIVQLSGNLTLRRSVGKAARNFIQENLSPTLVCRNVINTYQQICNQTMAAKIGN